MSVLNKKRFRRLMVVYVTIVSISAALLYLYAESLDTCSPRPIGPAEWVVKTTHTIQIGDVLRADDVERSRVPTRFLPPNPLLHDDLTLFVGKTVTHTIDADAMVMTTDFDPHGSTSRARNR